MKTVVMTFCPWNVGGYLCELIDHHIEQGLEMNIAWWAFGEYLYLKYRGVSLGYLPQEPTEEEWQNIQACYCFDELPLMTLYQSFFALDAYIRHVLISVIRQYPGLQIEGIDGQWEGTLESLPTLFLIFDETPEMLQQPLL